MSQNVTILIDGRFETFLLPDADQQVLPGVEWGHFSATFTPAFWAVVARLCQFESSRSLFRIGATLEEEVTACLLGGYGIPAEVGLAAFFRLRENGLLNGDPPAEDVIYQMLSTPLEVGQREIRYRFARQRSKYVSAALTRLQETSPSTENDLEFREYFLELEGIGPKTASWITRNWLESDQVAIIDVHIYRAGLLMGLYELEESPTKHYFEMENKFLALAQSIGVKASILDAIIWRQMKDAGKIVFNLIDRVQA